MSTLTACSLCRAESLDERLLADALDGRLDDFDFLSGCLVAGGVSDPCELADLHARYEELERRIDASSLRELHARLHAEILVGDYQHDATDLRAAICRGDYNCLSALAIYRDLCREAGVELDIWSHPGHVFLVDESSGARIEPGMPSWKTESIDDNTGRLTPPARRITPLQLLGKFYYNRGVLLLQEGRYADGLALLRTSLLLDPDDREAQGNLLAGLNNWAVALCRQERFAEARTLIEQGLAIDAGFAPLVANGRYLQDQAAP